jgi:hypothetical protein
MTSRTSKLEAVNTRGGFDIVLSLSPDYKYIKPHTTRGYFNGVQNAFCIWLKANSVNRKIDFNEALSAKQTELCRNLKGSDRERINHELTVQ